MKMQTVTVRVAELRKTEEFENRRYEIEYVAQIEEGDTVSVVQDMLEKRARDSVEEFFDNASLEEMGGLHSLAETTDPRVFKRVTRSMIKQLKKYRTRYGDIDE